MYKDFTSKQLSDIPTGGYYHSALSQCMHPSSSGSHSGDFLSSGI
jgi:hypothetical protein